jgi:hypothetical protein
MIVTVVTTGAMPQARRGTSGDGVVTIGDDGDGGDDESRIHSGEGPLMHRVMQGIR